MILKSFGYRNRSDSEYLLADAYSDGLIQKLESDRPFLDGVPYSSALLSGAEGEAPFDGALTRSSWLPTCISPADTRSRVMA